MTLDVLIYLALIDNQPHSVFCSLLPNAPHRVSALVESLSLSFSGGLGGKQGGAWENGTITGRACPKGLYGTFFTECPAGTYKNITRSDMSLCYECPSSDLPSEEQNVIDEDMEEEHSKSEEDVENDVIHRKMWKNIDFFNC